MEPLRAFLDANVLFSAALGGRSFNLLWSLAASQRTTLFTSRVCVVEAEMNLQRKRRDKLADFQVRMRSVHVVTDAANAITGIDGGVQFFVCGPLQSRWGRTCLSPATFGTSVT